MSTIARLNVKWRTCSSGCGGRVVILVVGIVVLVFGIVIVVHVECGWSKCGTHTITVWVEILLLR